MSKISVLLLDDDYLYIDNLSVYLMEHYRDKLKICSYNDPDNIKENLMAYKDKINIAVAGRNFFIHAKEIFGQDKVLFLDDGIQKEKGNTKGSIRKYSNVNDFVKCIISQIKFIDNKKYEHKTKSTAVGIFSASGGAGKSAVSAALAMSAGLDSKKVLYFSLEEISSTNVYFKRQTEKNMTNLIFYLSNDPQKAVEYIEDVISYDEATGVFFISPQSRLGDISEASPAEIAAFINALCTKGIFDYIVIDIPVFYDNRFFKILKECDTSIMILKPDETGIVKTEKLIEEIGLYCNKNAGRLNESILIVQNNIIDTTIKLDLGKYAFKSHCTIKYDKNIQYHCFEKSKFVNTEFFLSIKTLYQQFNDRGELDANYG